MHTRNKVCRLANSTCFLSLQLVVSSVVQLLFKSASFNALYKYSVPWHAGQNSIAMPIILHYRKETGYHV